MHAVTRLRQRMPWAVKWILIIPTVGLMGLYVRGCAIKTSEEALVSNADSGDKASVERLIKWGVDINCALDDGYTPLMCAAGKGHNDIVILLLNRHADVNRKGYNGATALRSALSNKHYDTVRLLRAAGARE